MMGLRGQLHDMTDGIFVGVTDAAATVSAMWVGYRSPERSYRRWVDEAA
jgi:hypothetical protein